MLASLADAPLTDPQLIYEPKYDGIRAIVEIAGPREVRLWSRLGNEKTGQFPEIVRALQTWAAAAYRPAADPGWRGRRARRCRRTRRIPASSRAAFTSASAEDGGASSRSDRADRLRCPARRTDRLSRSAAHRAPRRARKDPRPHAVADPPHERERARRRPGAVQAGARERMGGPHREAGRFALPVGQADARLAQAENRSRAGARHRRLDRAATHPRPFRRAGARASTNMVRSCMSATSAPASTRPSSPGSWPS